MNYLIPVLLLATFLYALIRRVSLFDSFTEGTREALQLTVSVLPYLAAIFLAIGLLRESGLGKSLADLLNPLFSLLQIPKELTELLILRPLSGSGSLVILEDIYSNYGVDSYPARVASVMMSGTDTVLYIAAVYFSTAKDKKTGLAIPISLLSSLIGTVAACLLCRVL